MEDATDVIMAEATDVIIDTASPVVISAVWPSGKSARSRCSALFVNIISLQIAGIQCMHANNRKTIRPTIFPFRLFYPQKLSRPAGKLSAAPRKDACLGQSHDR
ncbi:MAG: hypothetical protein JXR75_08435 [Rhodobacteraceae bacterium]|nr:hypothetical protein [Paracoccaceae bacterium]